MDDKKEFLLKLMFDNYYEEERRYDTICNKIVLLLQLRV